MRKEVCWTLSQNDKVGKPACCARYNIDDERHLNCIDPIHCWKQYIGNMRTKRHFTLAFYLQQIEQACQPFHFSELYQTVYGLMCRKRRIDWLFRLLNSFINEVDKFRWGRSSFHKCVLWDRTFSNLSVSTSRIVEMKSLPKAGRIVTLL